MKLKDFIRNCVCHNSLIRLWKPTKGGHQMIYKEDKRKPNNIDDVCMEWELLSNKVWQSEYNDCRVIGVKDICVDGFYREAINIVIDVNNHQFENISECEKSMNTYIVTYAPLTDNNHYSLQDLRAAKILSQLSKEEVKSVFEERCNVASSDIPTYHGMYVEVELLEDYLNALPTDTI